jgi:hypothetical protein
MQVAAFERMNLRTGKPRRLVRVVLDLLLASPAICRLGDDDLAAGDGRHLAGFFGTRTARESRATRSSRPVATNGASVTSNGTAWRCMFEPINARFASSCSRNGISEAAIETSCFGETSM